MRNAIMGRWKLRNTPVIAAALGAAASLYFSCFRFPLTPIWSANVQFAFAELANRLWDGQVFYRDFFYVSTPGHEVVYLLFFRLFGLRTWIPDVDLILVGAVSAALIAHIASKVFPASRLLPLLPALLFLAFALERVMHQQDSHRWSSSALMLAALAMILEKRTARRLVAAGALFGIASFFTQTQGVLGVAGLTMFLLWDGRVSKSGWMNLRRQSACVIVPFLLTVILTDSYFVWKAGLHAFVANTVLFPAIYLPRDPLGGSFHAYLSEIPPYTSSLSWLHGAVPYFFIHALVPFIYFAFFIDYKLRGKRDEETSRAMLVSIIGSCMFAGVALSPTFLRLATVSAPAWILFVYLLRGERVLPRVVIALLWMAAIFSVIHRPLLIQRSSASILQLPRGPIAFLDGSLADYQELSWLSKQTRPGETHFTVDETGILYPLALRGLDKTTIGYQDSGVTRPEDVADAIATLEKSHIKLIQWPPCRTASVFYDANQDNLGPLKTYVEMNYHLAKTFDSMNCGHREEIWMRNQ